MGFLKFLKREKKKDDLDELDLPPAPPPLEGFEENIPELPAFPEFGEEGISAPQEMPKFDFPEPEEKTPEFPSFPEIEEKPMPSIHPLSAPSAIPEPVPSIPSPMPEPEQESVTQEELEEQPRFTPSDIYSKRGRRLFEQEKRILRERPNAKTIYVRVENFKATLGSINMARSDLKKSEEALMKLENIKNSKDKSFDKMKSSLEDLQKKLIFIDKTLFKGE